MSKKIAIITIATLAFIVVAAVFGWSILTWTAQPPYKTREVYLPIDPQIPMDSPEGKIASNIVEVKFKKGIERQAMEMLATKIEGKLKGMSCPSPRPLRSCPKEEWVEWIVFSEPKTYNQLKRIVHQLESNPFVEYSGLNHIHRFLHFYK